ncbi:MAG: AsmA family protein [Acidobacteria bacterium]|nr:AsmA family protein [Acidobacteriota bacterium]
MKRILGWLLAAIALVLVVAPFTNAGRFGPRIQAGLQAALGRRVEIGAVRLHALTGPGFSVRNVVIHEDPRVSVEPFAYVGNLVVRIRLLGLLKGKLEFSSLRLENVHVNLMRTGDGAWNVQSLLNANREGGTPLTEVEVRDGRINFKFDDTKSAYYFTNADMDFSAADAENFDIWFAGEPARTDTLARGFGRVTARGRLRDSAPEPRMELDVRVDKSALQEISVLLTGADAGVHGAVQSQARVAGPISRLKIDGRLEMSELHHWSQPPRPGAFAVRYTGELGLPEQSLRLETDPKEPLRARLQLDQYLSTAQWAAAVAATGLRLTSVQEWMRPAGAAFTGMTLSGALDGEVRMGRGQPLNGTARASDLEWKWGGEHLLEAPSVEMEWSNGSLALQIPGGQVDGQAIALACEANGACTATSRSVEVSKLRPWLGAFGIRDGWVDALRSGIARGQATLANGQWTGAVDLRNAEVALPELEGPVRVSAATVQFQEGRIAAPNLRLRVAGADWRGTYRFDRDAERPHRFSLETGTLAVGELEAALRPLLRHQRGFLQRVLNLDKDAAIPGSGGAEVEIRANTVQAGGLEFTKVRAMARNEPGRLIVSALSGMWREGTLQGAGAVKLGSASPEYEWTGRLAGVPWAGGSVETEFKGQLRGGAELSVSGRMTAKKAGGSEPLDQIEGAYRFQLGRRGPALTLSELSATRGVEKLPGRASGTPDGPQTISFGADGSEVKFRVSLQPFDVTPETGSAMVIRVP